jgi:hypothetical protein
VLLSGCSAIDIERYDANTPKLDFNQFFSGQTKGWGIVQDRKGILTRQFTVDIDGRVGSDGSLTLDEFFNWSDGEKSRRTWIINKTGEHQFTGNAGDVHGSAEGAVFGNVLNWRYYLDIEVDGTSWTIKFDDWMFLVDEEILINKASMHKFGLKVGEVTIVFMK